ncbi:MAG: hypothetical protein J3K34DRAFT_446346 [Monoraphidium minutum]|nr:MAG: hypothetical protein J3K34DRAFT_446346 [Monoraphidium minutum]
MLQQHAPPLCAHDLPVAAAERRAQQVVGLVAQPLEEVRGDAWHHPHYRQPQKGAYVHKRDGLRGAAPVHEAVDQPRRLLPAAALVERQRQLAVVNPPGRQPRARQVGGVDPAARGLPVEVLFEHWFQPLVLLLFEGSVVGLVAPASTVQLFHAAALVAAALAVAVQHLDDGGHRGSHESALIRARAPVTGARGNRSHGAPQRDLVTKSQADP